jgi:hypothetical protein
MCDEEYNNNYKYGKIYKIVGNNDDGLVYIGSTCKTLEERYSSHLSSFRSHIKHKWKSFTSSFIIFDSYGVENCCIELIEDYPCKSKKELLKREIEIIDEFVQNEDPFNGHFVVNKNSAYRTDIQEQHLVDFIKHQDDIDKFLAFMNNYKENGGLKKLCEIFE